MEARIYLVAATISALMPVPLMLTAQTPTASAPSGKRDLSPTDLNSLRLRFQSVEDSGMGGCFPGFAGYDIEITDRKIRTWTYHDRNRHSGKSGSLTDDQLAGLRAILREWNTTISDAPWSPTAPYCEYRIYGDQSFDWKDDAATVPKCVLKLVNQLRAIVAALPEQAQKRK